MKEELTSTELTPYGLLDTGREGGGGTTDVMLVPSAPTHKTKQDRHQQSSSIKVVGSQITRSNLNALQLDLSKAVGNKVTETVSTEPTV